jgi:heterodisulfide reductase subunit A-like polyferredoxin
MAVAMLAVTLTCSDQGCDLEVIELVESLEQVELLVCEGCGCCLQAVGYAEAEEGRLVARPTAALAA